MEGNEIVLGSVGLSVILSILLRMIYNTINIPNQFKSWIAVFLGIALSGVAIWVQGGEIGRAFIVTYLVQGFMCGSSAVGIYEITKKTDKSDP